MAEIYANMRLRYIYRRLQQVYIAHQLTLTYGSQACYGVLPRSRQILLFVPVTLQFADLTDFSGNRKMLLPVLILVFNVA